MSIARENASVDLMDYLRGIERFEFAFSRNTFYDFLLITVQT